MARGIIVFGSPGSGTTTLGRAVAAQLGFAHFDLDDYLWRWCPLPAPARGRSGSPC